MHRKITNTVNVVHTLSRYLAYGVTLSTYFCRPSRVLHLSPTGCKMCFHDFLS